MPPRKKATRKKATSKEPKSEVTIKHFKDSEPLSYDDVTDFVSNTAKRLKAAGVEPIKEAAKGFLGNLIKRINNALDEIDPPEKKDD